jgi:hypothetical protein
MSVADFPAPPCSAPSEGNAWSRQPYQGSRLNLLASSQQVGYQSAAARAATAAAAASRVYDGIVPHTWSLEARTKQNGTYCGL